MKETVNRDVECGECGEEDTIELIAPMMFGAKSAWTDKEDPDTQWIHNGEIWRCTSCINDMIKEIENEHS